ncbi:uncharacterized protein MYCGRDRAFT_96651 [Zymoseptoria tritici IPO323]|uniref:Uncharacterized protein n=1 Tax=Zymoseptoria tritici (strain CBS 115943 / IPO323) TaxID=336722 RepID=F9XN26_ZYMTI|nr:uncharacterized protein MYCGRDRAFT_96651 [Zymoseptoria tritici IPO323]EGP83588.1 hypothetical protein MYCGRDRAFT_96651 [Zymoseptoria tritici IPO323]
MVELRPHHSPPTAKAKSQRRHKEQLKTPSKSPSERRSERPSQSPTVVRTLVAPGEQLHLLAHLQPNILPRTFRNLSLFDLAQEIQEIIYANLITGAATSTTPTSFIASCRRALYYARETLLASIILISRFDMGLWPPNHQPFFDSMSEVEPSIAPLVHTIRFKIENIDQSHTRSLSQLYFEFFRRDAFHGNAVHPPTPAILRLPTSCIGEDALGEIAELDQLVEDSFVNETDIERQVVNLPPLPIGTKAISVQFLIDESAMTEDDEEDEELSPDLRAYLHQQAMRGIQAAAQIHALSAGDRARDTDDSDRAVFQAIAFHTRVPQEYRTALWWFRERYLGGQAYVDDKHLFAGTKLREMVVYDRRSKREVGGVALL